MFAAAYQLHVCQQQNVHSFTSRRDIVAIYLRNVKKKLLNYCREGETGLLSLTNESRMTMIVMTTTTTTKRAFHVTSSRYERFYS